MKIQASTLIRRFAVSSTVFLASVAVLTSCAEPAGSGAYMPTPQVSILCATNRCKAAATGTAYVVYTTSSCTNSMFGETTAGSTTLTCNGSSCVGTVTTFSSPTIREGVYAVCVIVDFNSNYAGSAVPGQDSTGERAASSFVTGMGTAGVTSFTDI